MISDLLTELKISGIFSKTKISEGNTSSCLSWQKLVELSGGILEKSSTFRVAAEQATSNDVEGCCCNNSVATEHRSQGNQRFKSGMYEEAAACYTDALRFQETCTASGREAAASLYCNRSLCALRQYETSVRNSDESRRWMTVCEAYQDADGAVALNSNSGKALYRRACVLQVMGKVTEALADCKSAISTYTSMIAPVEMFKLRDDLELQVVQEATAGKDGCNLAGDNTLSASSCCPTAVDDSMTEKIRSSCCFKTRQVLQTASATEPISAAPEDPQPDNQTLKAPDLSEADLCQYISLCSQGKLNLLSSPTNGRYLSLAAACSRTPCENGPQMQTACSVKQASGDGDSLILEALKDGEGKPSVGNRSAQNDGDSRYTIQEVPAVSSSSLSSSPQTQPTSALVLIAGTDVLAREEPAAFVLTKQQRLRRCGGCGRRLSNYGAAHPCGACPLVLYCSRSCRERDTFHTINGPECGVAWPRLLQEETLLACRLAVMACQTPENHKHQKQMQCVNQGGVLPNGLENVTGRSMSVALGAADPAISTCSRIEQLPPCSFEVKSGLLNALLGHEEEVQDPDLMMMWCLQAHLVAACFNRRVAVGTSSSKICGTESNKATTSVGRQGHSSCTADGHLTGSSAQLAQQGGHNQLLRNNAEMGESQRATLLKGLAREVFSWLCRISVNGVALRPPLSASQADRYGVAIYLAASMFNHSCRPNVTLRFEGALLTARCVEECFTQRAAPRQMEGNKQHELCISYGPQEGVMTTAERQLALKQQYKFLCSCTACSNSPSSSEGMLAAEAAILSGFRCPHESVPNAAQCPPQACEGLLYPPPGALPWHLYSLKEPTPRNIITPLGLNQGQKQHCSSGLCLVCQRQVPHGFFTTVASQYLEVAAMQFHQGSTLASEVEAVITETGFRSSIVMSSCAAFEPMTSDVHLGGHSCSMPCIREDSSQCVCRVQSCDEEMEIIGGNLSLHSGTIVPDDQHYDAQLMLSAAKKASEAWHLLHECAVKRNKMLSPGNKLLGEAWHQAGMAALLQARCLAAAGMQLRATSSGNKLDQKGSLGTSSNHYFPLPREISATSRMLSSSLQQQHSKEISSIQRQWRQSAQAAAVKASLAFKNSISCLDYVFSLAPSSSPTSNFKSALLEDRDKRHLSTATVSLPASSEAQQNDNMTGSCAQHHVNNMMDCVLIPRPCEAGDQQRPEEAACKQRSHRFMTSSLQAGCEGLLLLETLLLQQQLSMFEMRGDHVAQDAETQLPNEGAVEVQSTPGSNLDELISFLEPASLSAHVNECSLRIRAVLRLHFGMRIATSILATLCSAYNRTC
ncbi:hypothetical protein CEUSTIGMA_g4737.t1 [Chlamydomonas eustigma]|uniref:MYND-type domain-containing protein n=1 Tax=Chlamydomonas eustigma TaxID=1157962 RepID=A0A250X2J2_9CHLO|nr:hypothetical protein CEUSTIGMA_g4737.t1 [Chlamydomonas eustigma]|eukprot:GAX77291.1 hypothetical protein CEUSTIGMA_g4737.t1 [Chlamydomonas eustigma]